MAANSNALREGAARPSEHTADVAAFHLTRLLPRRDRGFEKEAPRASPDDGPMTEIATVDFFHAPRIAARFEATRLAIAASASAALHAAALLGFVHFGRPALGVNGADQEIPIEIVIDNSARQEPAAAAERIADVQDKAEVAPQGATTAPTPPPASPQAASDAAPPPVAAVPPARDQRTPGEPTLDTKSDASSPPPPPAPVARAKQEAIGNAVQMDQKHAERRGAIEQARAEKHTRQAHEQAERRAAERERRREAARRSAARAEAEQRAERAEARRMAAVERGGAGSRPAAASGAHAARVTDFDAASYRALVARAVRAAVGSRCSLGAGSRVVIALSIGRTGAISGASISSPSGNAAFDAASLAAVRRAGPFPPLQGRSAVSVPVGVACR